METISRNLRIAVRNLARTPGFVLGALARARLYAPEIAGRYSLKRRSIQEPEELTTETRRHGEEAESSGAENGLEEKGSLQTFFAF